MIEINDPRIQEGCRRLADYWATLGVVDPDVISYFINPQFQGKSPWPGGRQAYRIVRTPRTTILASDGLSDPFLNTDIEDANGFGMEVFIETPDLTGGDNSVLGSSWAFKLIETFAMNVADWGGIADDLRRNKVVSTQFPGCADILPPDWLTEDGSAGFLINLPMPDRACEIDMPLAPILIVPLTLIRPRELEFVVERRAEGRRKLADLIANRGDGHISSLTRPSLI